MRIVTPESPNPLPAARILALAIYAGALFLYPLIGAHVRLPLTLPPATVPLAGVSAVVLAAVEYGLSLWLEARLLASARESGQQHRVLAAAAVVAAIGETMAIWGLALTLLGARPWALVLYSMCLLHGLHLAGRWPEYERAAES